MRLKIKKMSAGNAMFVFPADIFLFLAFIG